MGEEIVFQKEQHVQRPCDRGNCCRSEELRQGRMARAETAWGKVVLDQAEPERPFEEFDLFPRSNGSLGGF